MYINGYVKCNNQDFSFTYDEETLHLVPMNPSEIKPYDSFLNRKLTESLLVGITTTNKAIAFLNCHLSKCMAGYIAIPAGYILFNTSQVEDFEAIVFKGEIINFFYRPIQIIDSNNTIYDYENGGATIQLKTFDKIGYEEDIAIDNLGTHLSLGISMPINPLDSHVIDSLGSLNSYLRLTFDTSIPLLKFSYVYSWIYNLFTFLTLRTSIEFGDIHLQGRTDDGRYMRIANVYIRKHKQTANLNHDAITGYYFIKGHIGELLNTLNSKTTNLLFIPATEKEIKYVDPVKFMSCCSSLESAFLLRYGKIKEQTDENFLNAKQDIETYITNIINEYEGVKGKGKLRSAYKGLLKTVNLTDFSLADKYKYCLKTYDYVLKDYISKILLSTGLTVQNDSNLIPVPSEEELKQIPTTFAEHRNLLVHDHVEAFLPIHVAGYQIAQCIIYVLLMDNAHIDPDCIKQSIDIIFN